MAPSLLFDISAIDLDTIRHDTAAVESVNPHRGAMRLIDGIIWQSEDKRDTLAYKDIRHDEFWVPGHIPGSPVFPGVLMIEAAAQVASWVCLCRLTDEAFMGFAGVDKVKFRGQVVPGDRLLILCQEVELRRRRCICNTQGIVNGNLVFEAQITGMPMQVKARV